MGLPNGLFRDKAICFESNQITADEPMKKLSRIRRLPCHCLSVVLAGSVREKLQRYTALRCLLSL